VLLKSLFISSLGVVFTTPPKTTTGAQEFFAKYPEKPDKLPIKYFTQLKSADLQPISFVNVHGPELELYCDHKVALRKSMFKVKLKCLNMYFTFFRCSKTGTTLFIYRFENDTW
jgi:hypothetical protein